MFERCVMGRLTSFDYDPQTIVPVIASFDTDGHVRPLYVRILGESYKILSQWSTSHLAGITRYNCKVDVRGLARQIVLTYYNRERVWTIPRETE